MGEKTKKFQLILLGIFVLGIVIGVAMFAANRQGSGDGSDSAGGPVEIWGTLDFNTFQGILTYMNAVLPNTEVAYRSFDNDSFDAEYIDALASGNAPDLVILDDERILQERNRVLVYDYTQLPRDTYLGSFVDSSDIFLLHDGAHAFPFMIDPMVLYYNKDLLTTTYRLAPPTTWNELIETTPDYTDVTDTGTVNRAAIALGTTANVTHAPDVYSLLMMQLGNSLVRLDPVQGYQSTLRAPDVNGGVSPAEQALLFYTSFANRTQSHYSWNASLPNDRDMFLSGDLAFYLGYASEYTELAFANPNLNFSVAEVPQVVDRPKRTIARLYGLAIPRLADNVAGASQVITALTSNQVSQQTVNVFGLPSTRRDVLGVPATGDPLVLSLYQSSIIADAWLKPNRSGARDIFTTIINDYNASKDQASSLILDADDRLNDLYREANSDFRNFSSQER